MAITNTLPAPSAAAGFPSGIVSHTASPAFQEDTRNLAVALKKLGVIDDEDTILLTHPPHEDMLVLKAKQKAEMQAKLVAQHPELLLGKGGKKK